MLRSAVLSESKSKQSTHEVQLFAEAVGQKFHNLGSVTQDGCCVAGKQPGKDLTQLLAHSVFSTLHGGGT